MITISIDPVAFTFGSFEIRWYGIIVALAIMSLALWMGRNFILHKDRIPPVDPIIAIPAVASGFGMAKLFHVLDLWGYYSHNLGEVFSSGGLSVYGGIVGACLFFWIYSMKRGYNFWYIADLAAPGTILAQSIGRVACTINGCCYGLTCDLAAPSWLPWGIIYTHPNSYAPLGVAVIPTTIYEMIFGFALFGVLLKLGGRLKPDGFLFLLYLIIYSAWRVGIGFLRAGTVHLYGLHAAQYIAISVLVFAIAVLVYRVRHVKQSA